jgi:hypothetical protein
MPLRAVGPTGRRLKCLKLKEEGDSRQNAGDSMVKPEVRGRSLRDQETQKPEPQISEDTETRTSEVGASARTKGWEARKPA